MIILILEMNHKADKMYLSLAKENIKTAANWWLGWCGIFAKRG